LTVVTAVLVFGRTPLANAARSAFGFAPAPPPAPPPPVISSFTPASGPVTTIVTINGSGFTGATQVRFGSIASPAIEFVNDATLLATVPVGLGAPGTTITVDTPLGSATSGSIFGLVNGSAWINPSGGSFFTASNWSNNQVPTSSSDILITLPGFYTVTGPTGGTFRSLTLGAIGGSSNNQTLDINSPITFTNNIDIKHGGQFNLNGGTLSANGLNVASTFNWNAGNISVSTTGATVFPNATLNINGVGTKNLGGRLTNQGFLNWLGATTINATTGTQINNTATGTFSIQNSAALTGPGTLNNQGNFQKISGTGTSNFASWSLQNSGTFFIPGDGDVSLASVQFSSPGTLETELGAVNTTKITTGNASITGGTLQLDNSLNRNVGDTFTIIASTSGSGNFSAFTGLSAGPGRIFQPTPSFPAAYRVVVVNAPPPTIGSFAPTSGITGSSVTVTGTNFFSVNRVTLNNVPTTFSVDSDTQLRFTVPPTATSGQIRVTTATGSATSSGTFSVLPLISTFSPSSGSPTQQVRIFGSGFGGATAVRFGGTSATFTVNSPNQITAVVPFGAATGPIRVTVGSNSFDSVSNFTVVPASGGAPSITNIGPGCATVGQGIVISGTNFLGVTQVTFNGRQAEFTVLDNTRIDAVFPGAAPGAVTISVTSPTGTGSSGSFFNGSDGTFSFLGPNTAPVTTVQARTGSEFAVAYADGQGTFVGSVKSLIPWNFSQSFGPVLAFTYDPVRADTIFAGIALPPGARPGRNSASNPIVFRSDDNGLSWNQADTSLPPEVILANVVIAFPGPTTGSTTVVIGTNAGIFRSDDRGATWTSYNTGLTPQQIDSLAYSPASGGFLYAGLAGGQVYTRPIGSGSWSLSSNGLPGSSASNFFVAADPGNGQVAYVAANDFQVGTFAVFKTTDRGANWTPANIGLPNQPSSSLVISPAGNVLFVNVGGILYRSFDGAGSWSPVGVNLPGPVTTPVSFISNDGAQLLIGSKYGVFTTNDSGNTWSPLNRGFASPTVNQIAVGGSNRVYAQDSNGVLYRSTRDGASIDLTLDAFEQDVFLRPAPSDGGIIYVGGFFLESNKLVKSTDGGATWFPLPAIGLGVRDLAVDPGNPDTLFLLRSSGLTRSTDGGTSFQPFGSGLPSSARMIRFANANPNILYASGNGVDGVYRSTNGGATWSPVNTGLPLGSTFGITSIIPSPVDTTGNVCLVGTNDARIFRTADGGANWTQVSTLPLTGYTQFDTTDFVFYSSSVVYASYYFQPTNPNAPPEGFIQVSNDGGATWSEFSPGSSIGGIRHLAMETGGSGLLYAGTTLGAFAYNTQSACPAGPTVTSFTPTHGLQGSSVTITGTGFTGASEVSIAGFTTAAFTINSDTEIIAEVPSAAGSSGPICVTTGLGTGCSNDSFTIDVPGPPTVTSNTPTFGPAGTVVTVNGSNFFDISSVGFQADEGTAPATSFTVISPTQLTAVVPNNPLIGGRIRITGTFGSASGGGFSIQNAPTVGTFTPTSGGAGTTVTIDGTDFIGVTGVQFNGVNASSFNVLNSNQLIAVVPPGATTGPISVTNTLGTGTSATNFTVNITYNWINPTGGDFNDPANWSSGFVPGTTDIAIIDLPGTYTVTSGSRSLGGLTLGGLSGTQTFVLNGNLALNGPAVVNPNGFFNFGDGTLAGSGTLTVAGQISFIGSGAVYSAGTLTIQSGATATKNTSGNVAFNSPVNNSGTFITPDSLNVNAAFNNLSGSIFEVRGNGGFAGGGPLNIAAGATFRKTLGTSNFTPSGTPINNDGTVECQSGFIDLQGGGTGGGEFRSSAGASIIFRADYTFNNGAQLTGAGTSFLPGNVTLNGTVTMRNASIGGLGNTIAGAGNLVIPNGGTATVTGGGVTFAGTGTIEVQNGGTFNLNGIGHTFNRTVNNAGIVNWSQLDISIGTGAAINNLAGGFFRVQHSDRVITGTGSFNNAGTFEQPSGANVTVNVPFTNSGVINVPAVGFMTIANLTQTPTGTINSQLGGTSPGGNYSQLRTTNFTAAGTFNAAYINGFTASPGQFFDVVTFTGSRTGTFSAVNLPPVGSGQAFLSGFKPNSFQIGVIGTPVITSFSPTSGIVGTTVTLTGSNFTGTTLVRFNGVNASGFTIPNDTTITVNVPNGATTGIIEVTNPAGTGASATSFTVFQTPTVTAFTPTSGAAGTSVTVTGTNFTGTTSVAFNGTNASGFTVNSDTQITVAVPNGATTGAISVTNPAGTGTSSASFTVFQTPTVTSFTPTTGTFGTAVTITGTNFTGTTSVAFNGTNAPGFTVVNDTTITVSVPNGATTGPIAVTNPAGTGTSSANFNVILTFNWINPSGGDFNIGANWSSGVVPGPTDFAVIDLPGTYSVTITNVATTLGGLTLGGVSGTQTLIISNTFGGGFNLNGPGTVNPNGRITFNAGVLGGAGALNLTAGSTMTLESAFGKAVAGTLNNAGTIAYVSGSSDLTVNGTLNNQSGGLFDIPTDNTITVGGALNNLAGATLRKSAGTGPSFITTTGTGTFDNFGTLLCQSGQLRPNSVRIQNGSTFTATGSGLLLLNSTSGTTTFAAGSPTFTSNGATIDGDLAGTGSFTGLLKFNAGTITGTLTVTSGSTLTVLNTTFGKAVSGTLNNGGTVNYFAPSFDLNINPGGTFNNLSGGLFDLNTDNGLVIGTSAAFNNQAGSTFRKSGGTGTSVVANSGTFTNAGTIVAPLTGFLQINGLFTQTGTGVINTTLNGTTAGTNYSQLQLQSPTLGGTLNVALLGGFTPAAGDTFDVVTFSGARTGGFATVNLPPPSAGISYSGNFTGVASGAYRVVVNSTVPAVASFTPTSGPVGTSVTITGVNFTGATAVSFNGTSATTFTVVNDTTITATVPSGATTGAISVTTSNGTGTSATSFTVLQPPTVTAFTPTSGGIGASVTITGSGFTGATTVTFHLTPTTAFTVVDDTTITTTVPAGATTGPIFVTTAGGTGASAASFTVITGFDWINPSGGNFNDGSNWSGGIVPGPMDTANFNLAATYTVTGTGNVAGISQTDGNVTFNGTFTTGTFSDGGGSIALTNLGTLNVTGFGTVNHLFINNGGTLTIGNTFTVNGRLDMPSGTIQGPGDLLNNSTFNWDGGTVTGTGTLIVNGISGVGGAFLNIGTSATHVLNRNINASPTPGITGFVHDAAPNLTFGTGVTITNGGEYFVDVEKTYPATVTFNNTNRVNKVVGTGTFEFSGPFNNGGQVAVYTGEVRFTGGGTQISGNGVRYSALANGTITFAGGNYTLGPGDVAGGQPGGLVRITGATVITLASDFAIGDPTRLEAGATITGPGSLIVIDTGTLDWRGGTIGGETGSGNLVINNGGGQLLLNGPDPKDLLRTLLNDGLILWNDGTIQGSTTTYIPTIQNRSTGIFRVQNDGDTMVFNGSFINQGLFEKPSGSGTNLIRWNVQNQGILRVPSTTGILFIEQFVQTSAGFLEVTVGGSTEGVNLSQLQTIDSTLAGTLNISLAPGFTPTQGQSFPVITFDTGILRPSDGKTGKTSRVRPKTVSGDFDVLNGTGISGGLSFRPVNAFSAYSLKVVGAPVITSFSPSSGQAGTSVLITGLDFDGATSVQFNGTEVSSFTVSPLGNQITTTVPTGATTGPITVTTQLGTGTSPTNFVVNAAPTITSFTPTSGPVGTVVTITGANFTGATGVTFNGTTATGFTVNSDSQITATVPVGASTGPISVTTPSGTGTSSTNFTVTLLPPVINGFTPARGPVGTVVTINGNNFDGVTSVQFNGVPAGFTISPLTTGTPTEPVSGGYNTGGEPVAKGAGRTTGRVVGPRGTVRSIPKASTTITATVPAGATTGFITVTGPGGTATSASQFQVTFPPTITAFSPTQGPPGTSVVITGTNFTGATSVAFNGTSATNFTVNSATQITAVVPAAATTGRISITTPDGTGMSVGNFVVCGYTVAPTSFIVTSAGGDRSVTVATFAALGQLTKIGVKDASLCPWTAVSNSSFITILTGSTGTGNGTVTFRVAPFVGSGTRSGTITVAGQTVTITQQPSFVAGDFNGDLKSDLLWRNIATGQSSIWLLDGTNFNQNLPLSSSETCWFVGGVNDFTGDGQVDILWRNQTITGANGLWRFSGPTVVEGLTVTPDQPNLNWVMNCTGDFNGDGKPDIVLRNSQTGAAEIWLMNGVNRTSVVALTVAGLPATEQFVGSGDFSGDGQTDLLVRNQAAGTLRVITLNGTTPTGTLTIPTLNSNWELSAVGDFNADGRADLVWRNTTDGSNVIWLMNGTTLIQSQPLLAVPDPNWRIVGPK
jgi:hypothetical protein